MDKIFVKKDKIYEEFAKELYEHGALDKENFEIISNPNKLSESKDYAKENYNLYSNRINNLVNCARNNLYKLKLNCICDNL